jgi:hypothetical protein
MFRGPDTGPVRPRSATGQPSGTGRLPDDRRGHPPARNHTAAAYQSETPRAACSSPSRSAAPQMATNSARGTRRSPAIYMRCEPYDWNNEHNKRDALVVIHAGIMKVGVYYSIRPPVCSHENVPAGGQVEVSVGGQAVVSAPRVSCPGRGPLRGDGVGANQSPHRAGGFVEEREGTDAHIGAAFPGGGQLARYRSDLRHDA